MNKGRIAWLVRGRYKYPLRDEDDWQILFEQPKIFIYKEVKQVVLFEIE